jgi:predicted RNA-binding protein with PUA-like domain
MSRKYWLMKSEPTKYSFAQLLRDQKTIWDGVRNFEARNNLRAMKVGDLALFYHSNDGKSIVGVARVTRGPYPDPTAQGEDWSVVEIEPVSPLKAPVSFDAVRSEPDLAEIALLKRPRISVVPSCSRCSRPGARGRRSRRPSRASRSARTSSSAPRGPRW